VLVLGTPQSPRAEFNPGGAIYHKMQEHDVRRMLADPRSMIGWDGLPHGAHPHPSLPVPV